MTKEAETNRSMKQMRTATIRFACAVLLAAAAGSSTSSAKPRSERADNGEKTVYALVAALERSEQCFAAAQELRTCERSAVLAGVLARNFEFKTMDDGPALALCYVLNDHEAGKNEACRALLFQALRDPRVRRVAAQGICSVPDASLASSVEELLSAAREIDPSELTGRELKMAESDSAAILRATATLLIKMSPEELAANHAAVLSSVAEILAVNGMAPRTRAEALALEWYVRIATGESEVDCISRRQDLSAEDRFASLATLLSIRSSAKKWPVPTDSSTFDEYRKVTCEDAVNMGAGRDRLEALYLITVVWPKAAPMEPNGQVSDERLIELMRKFSLDEDERVAEEAKKELKRLTGR